MAGNVTTEEIANLARTNFGITWAIDGFTEYVWGSTDLAGAPLSYLGDLTLAGDAAQTGDKLHAVPHSDAIKSSTDNVAVEGWTSLYAGMSVTAPNASLHPGDAVWVYKAGNVAEQPVDATGGCAANTFVVVSVEAGDVQVVDSWSAAGIIWHSLGDITDAFSPSGRIEAACVSRVEESLVAENLDGAITGSGSGDFSSLALSLLQRKRVVFYDSFNRADSEIVGNGWVEVRETLPGDPTFIGSSTFNVVSDRLEVDFDAEGVFPARNSTYQQPYMTRSFGADLGETGFELSFSFIPGDDERVRHFVGLAESSADQLVADQANGWLLIPASGFGIELGRSGSDIPAS